MRNVCLASFVALAFVMGCAAADESTGELPGGPEPGEIENPAPASDPSTTPGLTVLQLPNQPGVVLPPITTPAGDAGNGTGDDTGDGTEDTGSGGPPTEPWTEPGNPTCVDVLGPGALTVAMPSGKGGTFTNTDGVRVTVTTTSGSTLDWTSTAPIHAVIVKGGPHAQVYPSLGGAEAGEGLSTPNGAGTSHVLFCYLPANRT